MQHCLLRGSFWEPFWLSLAFGRRGDGERGWMWASSWALYPGTAWLVSSLVAVSGSWHPKAAGGSHGYVEYGLQLCMTYRETEGAFLSSSSLHLKWRGHLIWDEGHNLLLNYQECRITFNNCLTTALNRKKICGNGLMLHSSVWATECPVNGGEDAVGLPVQVPSQVFAESCSLLTMSCWSRYGNQLGNSGLCYAI